MPASLAALGPAVRTDYLLINLMPSLAIIALQRSGPLLESP
jgi:hypothetical protein